MTEEEPFTHSGRHFRTRGAVVQPRPFQQPHPPFYIGGVSPASWPVIGKHADVYLAWGDTVGHIAQTFAVAKRAAADHGREHELRLGVRIQVCVRDDEEQAWRDAEALIADVTDEQRERRITSQLESHIDARMKELARAGEHRIGPHLWSGLTTARGGGAVMIVGNPEQVLRRSRSTSESAPPPSASPASRTTRRPSASAAGDALFRRPARA